MRLTLNGLKDYAKRFVDELPRSAMSSAHMIGLSGELGAGKTTFVQFVAKELGILGNVSNPTFVIAKSYAIAHPVFRKLIHVDAYRLSKSDPDTLGWRELMRDPAHLILVEWSENLADFPESAPRVSFTVIGEGVREVNESSSTS